MKFNLSKETPEIKPKSFNSFNTGISSENHKHNDRFAQE